MFKTIIVCPNCGEVLSYSSYFGGFICDKCKYEHIIRQEGIAKQLSEFETQMNTALERLDALPNETLHCYDYTVLKDAVQSGIILLDEVKRLRGVYEDISSN